MKSISFLTYPIPSLNGSSLRMIIIQFTIVILIGLGWTNALFAITRYKQYTPDIVILPPLEHPIWNLRAAYASYAMGLTYYLAIRDLEIQQGPTLGTANTAGLATFGLLSTFFVVNAMLHAKYIGHPEHLSSLRYPLNDATIETMVAQTFYLPPGAQRSEPATYGQQIELNYVHRWLLNKRPLNTVNYRLNATIQGLPLLEGSDFIESLMAYRLSPLSIGMGFQDDEFWRDLNASVYLGPTFLSANLYATRNVVSGSDYWNLYGITTDLDITIPILGPLALGTGLRYIYFFKIIHPAAQNEFEFFSDMSRNTALSTLGYTLKLKLLSGNIRGALVFGQEFITGNKGTKIDTLLFGINTSFLW